jgi:hypothetical protein
MSVHLYCATCLKLESMTPYIRRGLLLCGGENNCYQVFQPRQRMDGYPAISAWFSAGIFLMVASSMFKCDVTTAGGRRRIQLFIEKSMY